MTSPGAATDAATPTSPPPPGVEAVSSARRSAGAWILLAVVTALALGADLWTKHLAFAKIADAPVVIRREDVLAIAQVNPLTISQVLPSNLTPVPVIPYVLEFTLVLNSGAVFGMGPGQRWFFMSFTGVAIAAAIMVFAYWTRARDRWAHVAIGLLISGGIGNFYDRMVYGCVRDFIHPLPDVTWPFGWSLLGRREVWPYVSNVADAFLLVGIAILAVYLWKHDPKRASAAATPA